MFGVLPKYPLDTNTFLEVPLCCCGGGGVLHTARANYLRHLGLFVEWGLRVPDIQALGSLS